jgi:hypothetical protein
MVKIFLRPNPVARPRPASQRWRAAFGRTPPDGLTKDIIRRMIAWRIQEQAFGGLDRKTLKLLDDLARGKNAGLLVTAPTVSPPDQRAGARGLARLNTRVLVALAPRWPRRETSMS